MVKYRHSEKKLVYLKLRERRTEEKERLYTNSEGNLLKESDVKRNKRRRRMYRLEKQDETI